MKLFLLVATSWTLSSAFIARVPPAARVSCLFGSQSDSHTCDVSNFSTRKSFLEQVSVAGIAVGSSLLWNTQPASARGRATLERSYERYSPRIRAGGTFYGTDLRQLVAKSDWAGIKNALQEPPERKKEDLIKPDSGVAERARQAGGFSDARVLVAADLLAGAFSDNSVSAKTKKMQSKIAKLREIVQEMQKTARLALGEESTGGLFGFGAKKPSDAELAKRIRELYVAGGNEWNEYILEANDSLALQFDRFDYIK